MSLLPLSTQVRHIAAAWSHPDSRIAEVARLADRVETMEQERDVLRVVLEKIVREGDLKCDCVREAKEALAALKVKP